MNNNVFQKVVQVTGITVHELNDALHQLTPRPNQPETVDAVTNSVTEGGTDGTITDITNLTTYSASAAIIRNDIYQLARSVKQLSDCLRNLGYAE